MAHGIAPEIPLFHLDWFYASKLVFKVEVESAPVRQSAYNFQEKKYAYIHIFYKSLAFFPWRNVAHEAFKVTDAFFASFFVDLEFEKWNIR